MNRQEALSLMQEHTQSASLRQHMLAVEAAMRSYAGKFGEDPEPWGLVGLLHDFDYEKFPNPEHSPTDGHPAWGVNLLRSKGVAEPVLRAVLGHATYSGVPRDTQMAKALFAVDVRVGASLKEFCGPRGAVGQEEAQRQGIRPRRQPGRGPSGRRRARRAAR